MNPKKLKWLSEWNLCARDIADNWGLSRSRVQNAFKKYHIKQSQVYTWRDL